MKKQNISVALYLMGGNDVTAPASAYDQLLAHRDIVYNYIPGEGDENAPAKYVYPYHAVNFAVVTRESETVEAPTDAICNDGGAVDLVTLVPQAEPAVAIVSDDVCELFANPVNLLASVTLGDETLEVADYPSDFYDACVNGDFDWRMTINGTTSPWISENEPIGESMEVSAHFSYPCGQYNEGDTVSVTVDVKYKGETGTITIPNVHVYAD